MHQRTCFGRGLCVPDRKCPSRRHLRERRHRLMPGVSPAVPERCNAALTFRKECGREKSCSHQRRDFPGSRGRRKAPVPWCLSRLRKARAPDLTPPLRSLQPPSPRLTCAPLPRIPAPARQLSPALPLHCPGHPESRDRAGAFVKEGPQGEITRRHHRDMHRAMHRAMHRSLHRYMPAPPGAATGPL